MSMSRAARNGNAAFDRSAEVTRASRSHAVPVHVISRNRAFVDAFRARGYQSGMHPARPANPAGLETLLPDLRREVVVKRIATPFHFRDRLNAFQGSAFSLAPRLTQSAYFRPHNRDPRIPGLYLVGAGTHPGAGVPGVINSAKATFSVILEDFAP